MNYRWNNSNQIINNGEIIMSFEPVKTLLYFDEGGPVSLDMMIDRNDSSMWTTAGEMTELFGEEEKTINKLLNNIFKEEELAMDEVSIDLNRTSDDGIINDFK